MSSIVEKIREEAEKRGEKIGEKIGEKKNARRIAVEMFKDGFEMEAVAKYCPILDHDELFSLLQTLESDNRN